MVAGGTVIGERVGADHSAGWTGVETTRHRCTVHLFLLSRESFDPDPPRLVANLLSCRYVCTYCRTEDIVTCLMKEVGIYLEHATLLFHVIDLLVY